MAISETTLKGHRADADLTPRTRRGGLLGKQLEPVVVDPASNWPLFAEKARELAVERQGSGGVWLLDFGQP